MNIPYTTKLLYKKPKISFPDSINSQLALISFTKRYDPVLFGSAIYRMQRYAGDIDVLQNFQYEKELTVIQQFVKKIKQIVRGLGRLRYFSEFKCGFDPYFIEKDEQGNEYELLINDIVGNLENGRYKPEEKTIDYFKSMLDDKVISDNEYEFAKLICNNIDKISLEEQQNAYTSLFDLVRNKKVLRWSAKEILNGYKIIRGSPYKLSDALKDNTMCKLDIIAWQDNKFVEITNMISLCYIVDGKITPINIDSKKLHNPENLKDEIEKLYFNNKYYSPLKCCKRMFAYQNLLKDTSNLEELGRILRGDISSLYQIKSELDAILIILNTVKNPPMAQINYSLSEIKGRFNYILDLSEKSILNISDKLNKIIKLRAKKSKTNELEKFIVLVKYYTSKLTISGMNTFRINPIPSHFLPEKHKYDTSIIRKPEDKPTLKYDLFCDTIAENIAIAKIENMMLEQKEKELKVQEEIKLLQA